MKEWGIKFSIIRTESSQDDLRALKTTRELSSRLESSQVDSRALKSTREALKSTLIFVTDGLPYVRAQITNV